MDGTTILNGSVLFEDLVNHIIDLTSLTGATIQHNHLFRTVRISCEHVLDDNKRGSYIEFKKKVIDPSQVITQPIIMHNPTQIIDFNRINKLTSFVSADYSTIMVMKLVCKKLLRLSQCSKSLHILLMKHTIWNDIRSYFTMNPLVYGDRYPFEFNVYSNEHASRFLARINRGSETAWSDLQSILNYGKPVFSQLVQDKNRIIRKRTLPLQSKKKPTSVKRARKK